MGRQIEALEALLGTKLFLRSPRGPVPTMAALDLMPHAEAIAAAAAALVRVASGGAADEAGVVRQAAGEFVGHEVLPPILVGFCHRHPRIALELTLPNYNEDLLRHDVDIAVRMMRPTQHALLVR